MSSLILMGQNMGLFEDPSETSQMASEAEDQSLFFVPRFRGGSVDHPGATTGFIGLTPKTKPRETVRAILEAIAYVMKQLLEIMEIESPQSLACDTIM